MSALQKLFVFVVSCWFLCGPNAQTQKDRMKASFTSVSNSGRARTTREIKNLDGSGSDQSINGFLNTEIFPTPAIFSKAKQLSDQKLQSVPESSNKNRKNGGISSEMNQENDILLKPIPKFSNIVPEDNSEIFPIPASSKKPKETSDQMLESVPEIRNNKWESGEISNELSQENDTLLKPVPQNSNTVPDDSPVIIPISAVSKKPKESSDQMLESVPGSSNNKWESEENSSDLSQGNDTILRPVPQFSIFVPDDTFEIFPNPAISNKPKQSSGQLREFVPETRNNKWESGEISNELSQEKSKFSKPNPQFYNSARDDSLEIFPTPAAYTKFKQSMLFLTKFIQEL